MVGMGAMVGGGTGAVMTATTMTFEMTRDYDIVMPMILAVATSVGVRRLLSRENIYTLKLVRRGRSIPKALHANMFMVRHAREVMDSDVLVLPAEDTFDTFLRQHEADGLLRHVVVTQQGRLFGVIRVNTRLRRGLEGQGLSRRSHIPPPDGVARSLRSHLQAAYRLRHPGSTARATARQQAGVADGARLARGPAAHQRL